MSLTPRMIKDAHKHVKKVTHPTPVVYSPVFSAETGHEIWMKPENMQRTGAYKLRGAYNKIRNLPEDCRSKGLIASSAGNHAQGVAYAAQMAGAPATIVMPVTTPLIKVENTRKYGAEVILHGHCYDDAYEKAMDLAHHEGYTFVHPFDDYHVMAGQGTVGLEIMEEIPDADIILVPVGGGGLISGIAVAAKSINPNVKVIGVEPLGARAMKLSLDRGKLSSLDLVNTIADGVAVKTPGSKTFPLVQQWVDEIVTVSDFDIMEAFLLLMEQHKMVAESAGVLALAGAKKIRPASGGGLKVVSVISGGNIDVVTISTMIDRGLVSRGRVCCFSVDLPDTPGELLKISELLFRTHANVIKLDHNQFKTPDRFQQVQLEVTIETNGHGHLSDILGTLVGAGYVIKKIV